MGNEQTLRGEEKGEGGDKYLVDCWLLIVDWKNHLKCEMYLFDCQIA